MANISNLTVRIRAKDELSPVLRSIRGQVWLLRHPRVALALIAGGWGLFGIALALLAVVLTGGRI